MSLQETNDLKRQSSLNAMKRIESCYNLIVEMKLLFAFMTKGEKKYADPTAMIRHIVDDFGNQMKIGDQQDITEVSEGFLTRIHEGIQAIVDPFIDNSQYNPFEEEGKDESNLTDSDSETSKSEEVDILKQVENYSKNVKSEGFIKDLFYGKQVETTEIINQNDAPTIEESEFLMNILNIEVILDSLFLPKI